MKKKAINTKLDLGKKCPKCRKDYQIRLNSSIGEVYVHSGISCCLILEQPV